MLHFNRPLVSKTEQGLYCEVGGFYIDPSKGVDLAIVTHAHSDHARRGSRRYLCERTGLGLLKTRLGKNIHAEGLAYGEAIRLGDVHVSLHSAGHILGSAQVRIQRGEGSGAEVWVVSGDYKRDPDPSCDPFEVVRCDTFITEATFGTPKYTWNKNARHGEDIHRWWSENRKRKANSVLFGYSLGKGQRVLAELAPHAEQPILIHDAMVELTECYRLEKRWLAPTHPLEDALKEAVRRDEPLQGELILAPPSVLVRSDASYFGRYRTAFASGWMQGGSFRSYDHGFVMSDHADWNDLNRTVRECGAARVFVQHRNGALVRHLRAEGIEAYPEEDLEPSRYARLEFKPVQGSLFGEERR